MPALGRKASRTKSRPDEFFAKGSSKAKLGLAVDTSFSRHRAETPEQVFPQREKAHQARFVSLADVQSSQDDAPPERITHETRAPRDHLTSRVYVPSRNNRSDAAAPGEQKQFSLPHPVMHKRIQGLRPSPLNLTTDVSPSDRAITIGIEIPSDTTSKQAPISNNMELPTPTIVITPAKEDFGHVLTMSPEDVSGWNGPRPTSSIYSAYTNTAFGLDNERTPPVPPLPLFASQSNATLHRTGQLLSSTGPASDLHPSSRSVLSLQTVFEDGSIVATQTRSADSKRPTIASYASRRSKGWWNIITSPFSPSGKSPASYLHSLSHLNEEDRTPMLAKASGMARSGRLATQPVTGDFDDEPRSAPEVLMTGNGIDTTKTAPQRSITAPGALDLGAVDTLNIYRRPSKGAATAYYNHQNKLSRAKEPDHSGTLRDMGDDDWSPSQSCYRQSCGSSQGAKGGMRDSEFYLVPGAGEAAEYYNPNKRFPSFVPYGAGDGDRDLNRWSPRDSVAPATIDAQPRAANAEGSLLDSSTSSDSDRSSYSGSIVSPSDSKSSFGGPVPSSAEDRHSAPLRPPYPDDQGPFDDLHAAHPEPRGYGADLTPKSGEVTAFKDFSATHPAAHGLAFRTPSMHAVNPGNSGMQRHNSEDVFSPIETPLVEEAQTATFVAPEAHRQVEVMPSRQPTPAPPGTGLGIGNATMMSRGTRELASGDSGPTEQLSGNPAPYWYEPQPARSYAGPSYSAEETGRGDLYAPSQGLSEKASIGTMSSFRGEEKALDDTPAKKPWYRRFGLCLASIVVLLLTALLVVLLLVFLPFGHDSTPVQAQWLNLTGFPPLPTGVATVIQPKAIQNVGGCTEPNFRFQIRFRDGVLPSNETAIEPSNITLARRGISEAPSARGVVRRSLWSNPLFASSPAPPSKNDQIFLGRTTDNASAPYDGEETPFYLSLLNASALTSSSSSSSKLTKRDWQYPYPTHTTSDSNSSTSSFHFPGEAPSSSNNASEAAETIPHAATQGNEEPASAELYPFAYAQPLRLYDRGLESEHYGFYTYFDRSLYVSSPSGTTNATSNSSSFDSSGGNVPLASASAVCTWSQTRLLVQIWTRQADVARLNATSDTDIPAVHSTANDMTAPGSFPYRITITLDRHGGEASKKGAYCHSLDDEHRVLQDVRTWAVEDRAFGGELVHAAAVPTNDGMTLRKRSDDDHEGIDGGTGGCQCQWQNWS
ncbi:hypothetical protein LTR09_008739 [Extremus antarcticus]|uniref:Uncharacterized protein n=1 Tax=Extremus antarcticus TaxID=702011 RepID=A0AAJ0DHQ3_9PEZI|nr:hypothetical protein LTR09_008739 [Extremus antarcticus]